MPNVYKRDPTFTCGTRTVVSVNGYQAWRVACATCEDPKGKWFDDRVSAIQSAIAHSANRCDKCGAD